MRITILTYGSRGDVQPFIALSLGLMERGHVVKLAAPGRFKSLIEEHGIRFIALAGEPEELSRRLNDTGNNPVRMVHDLMDHAVGIGADILRQTEDACRDADLIIHTFTHAVGAHTIAREKNIPDIHIQIFPMFTPTGEYPNVTLPDLKFPFLNRLTHILSGKISWWGSRLGFERVRRRAGLRKRRLYWPFAEDPLRPRTPILCAWSPNLLPPSSDWPPHVHVTGWYFSHRHNSLPDGVQKFLASGESPVCISFGSMVNRNKQGIDAIVREALNLTHNRGIILSGWSQVKNPSSTNTLYLEEVAHDQLLPHCKMIIHHGGAGTTSAGLRAGIPNVIIPFTADQPFWGRMNHEVGAGPIPIPVKKLSTQKLVQAIREAESGVCREQAQMVGQRVRSEDGVGRAIGLIEKFSNAFHTRQ